MSLNLQASILDMTRQLHMASLATITEDGRPWVRYVMARAYDDLSIRLASHVGARKVQHIEANPEIHLLAGVNDPAAAKQWVQVQGTARLMTDDATRREFWYPMLEHIFQGADDPDYGVITITPYRIELHTMGHMTPEVWSAEHGK